MEPITAKPRISKSFVSLSLMLAVAPSSGLAGFWPSGAQWGAVAVDALKDPYTWFPAAGAAVTGLTGLDHTISDWAVDKTPIFGSPESARDASDYLDAAGHVGMLVTAVGVPGPWSSMLRRMLVEETAVVTTIAATTVLKGASDRRRPDGSDEESFPSGHSSRAFAYAAMGSMNIEALPLKAPVQTGLRLGVTGLAAATAWARVEAGVHFPSDVLAGAALGNFIGRLIQGALIGEQENLRVDLYFGDDSAFLSLTFRLQ
jgi:membrane-associated phospholipid phosphatase